MNRPAFHLSRIGLLATLAMAAPAAWSQVDVTVNGNTASATVLLGDIHGNTYDADVTIVFDGPENLSPASLNLTAQLVDPNDPSFNLRLPIGVTLDPDFPMMITVEPPALDWIFTTQFDVGEDGTGVLAFLNTYEFEIHTHNLLYVPQSKYRLMKAPVGEAFDDVTTDVLPGSTRARGRGGVFSQFVIGVDNRIPLLTALTKTLALELRLVPAILDDTLRLELAGLVTDIETALLNPLLGCGAALPAIDDLLATLLEEGALGHIPNHWQAPHDTSNDAGELESLAYSLRFTLLRCAP